MFENADDETTPIESTLGFSCHRLGRKTSPAVDFYLCVLLEQCLQTQPDTTICVIVADLRGSVLEGPE